MWHIERIFELVIGYTWWPTQVQPELNGSTWSGTSGSTTTGGQSLAHRAIESFNNKVQSLSTKLPKKAWQEDVVSDDEGNLELYLFSSPFVYICFASWPVLSL